MTIPSNGTYTGVGDAASTVSTWNINTGSAISASTTLFVAGGTGYTGAVVMNGGTASFSGADNIGNSYNNGTDFNGVGT